MTSNLTELQSDMLLNARDLQTKASQINQLTQLTKAGGGTSLVGGLLLTIASGGVGAIPLLLGGAAYAAATLREMGTTGSLTPLPWVNLDVLAAFNARRTMSGARVTVDIADYQHLSTEEKAVYTLCTALAPVTENLLEGRSEEEQEVVFTALKENLLRHHRTYNYKGLELDLLDDPHNNVRRIFGTPGDFAPVFTKTLPYAIQQRLPASMAPASLAAPEQIYEPEPMQPVKAPQKAAQVANNPDNDFIPVDAISLPATQKAKPAKPIDHNKIPFGKSPETLATPTALESIATDAPDSAEAREFLETKAPSWVKNGQLSRKIMELPIKKRAKAVIEALAESGFNVGRFLNTPVFCSGYQQQSGKTTLTIVMGILEKAMYGRELYLCTTSTHDALVKYPVAWDGLAHGSTKDCLNGFITFAEEIDGPVVNDRTWILDEFAKVIGDQVDDETTKKTLWMTPLTCLAKRAKESQSKNGGEKMRAILHGNTASMCGVPRGATTSFQNEITLAQAKRARSQDGTYQPSGLYEIQDGESGTGLKATGEYLFIPKWLLEISEFYRADRVCPVLSMLILFPELRAENAASEPRNLGVIETEQYSDTEAVDLDDFEPFGPPSVGELAHYQAPTIEVEVDQPDELEPEQLPDETKEPLVEGTRYTLAALNEKLEGLVNSFPSTKESISFYDLTKNFSGDDKSGVRSFLPSFFERMELENSEKFFVKGNKLKVKK